MKKRKFDVDTIDLLPFSLDNDIFEMSKELSEFELSLMSIPNTEPVSEISEENILNILNNCIQETEEVLAQGYIGVVASKAPAPLFKPITSNQMTAQRPLDLQLELLTEYQIMLCIYTKDIEQLKNILMSLPNGINLCPKKGKPSFLKVLLQGEDMLAPFEVEATEQLVKKDSNLVNFPIGGRHKLISLLFEKALEENSAYKRMLEIVIGGHLRAVEKDKRSWFFLKKYFLIHWGNTEINLTAAAIAFQSVFAQEYILASQFLAHVKSDHALDKEVCSLESFLTINQNSFSVKAEVPAANSVVMKLFAAIGNKKIEQISDIFENELTPDFDFLTPRQAGKSFLSLILHGGNFTDPISVSMAHLFIMKYPPIVLTRDTFIKQGWIWEIIDHRMSRQTKPEIHFSYQPLLTEIFIGYLMLPLKPEYAKARETLIRTYLRFYEHPENLRTPVVMSAFQKAYKAFPELLQKFVAYMREVNPLSTFPTLPECIPINSPMPKALGELFACAMQDRPAEFGKKLLELPENIDLKTPGYNHTPLLEYIIFNSNLFFKKEMVKQMLMYRSDLVSQQLLSTMAAKVISVNNTKGIFYEIFVEILKTYMRMNDDAVLTRCQTDYQHSAVITQAIQTAHAQMQPVTMLHAYSTADSDENQVLTVVPISKRFKPTQ